MELSVYWTQFAEEKLQDIYNHYKIKATINVAENLVSEIVEKTIYLQQNPYIGKVEELLVERKQEFRFLIHKNYKIIYWTDIEFQRIIIANIFDCRQNPEKITETSTQ